MEMKNHLPKPWLREAEKKYKKQGHSKSHLILNSSISNTINILNKNNISYIIVSVVFHSTNTSLLAVLTSQSWESDIWRADSIQCSMELKSITQACKMFN